MFTDGPAEDGNAAEDRRRVDRLLGLGGAAGRPTAATVRVPQYAQRLGPARQTGELLGDADHRGDGAGDEGGEGFLKL